MTASIETTRKLENTILHDIIHQRLTWKNDMYGGLSLIISIYEPARSLMSDEVHAAYFSISEAHQDVWPEFSKIQDVTGLLILPSPTESKPIPAENLHRSILIMAVGNMVHRLRDLTTSATPELPVKTKPDIDIENIKITEYTDRKYKPITFKTMIGYINDLYKLFNLPSEEETLNSFIQIQQKRLNTHNSEEESGKLEKSWVSAYYGLLARTATSDTQLQSKIVAKLLKN